MKPHLVAALAALAVGSAAAVATVGQDKDKPAPTRLGFVDLTKAYDTYRKHADLMSGLNAKSKAMSDQLKKRSNAIDELEGTLNTMNPDNPKYAATEREITLARSELKYDRESARTQLEREATRLRGGVYKEICQESEAFGAEHGLAAVFLYLPPSFDYGSNFDLFSNTRAVLCRDAQLDVTTEVVARLNAQLPPPAPVAPAAEPGEDPKKPK
jgi:Skp family chaperone for outer membrane proteins